MRLRIHGVTRDRRVRPHDGDNPSGEVAHLDEFSAGLDGRRSDRALRERDREKFIGEGVAAEDRSSRGDLNCPRAADLIIEGRA